MGGSEVGFHPCCSTLPWQHVPIAAIRDGCHQRYGALVLGVSCGRASATVRGEGDGAARQFWGCAEHAIGSSLTAGEVDRVPGTPAVGTSYLSLPTLQVWYTVATERTFFTFTGSPLRRARATARTPTA